MSVCIAIARRDLVQVQAIVQKLESRNQLNQHKDLVSAATGNKVPPAGVLSPKGPGGGMNHAFPPSSNAAINSLTNMFAHEIKIARTLMRLIEIQNSFVSDVESAMIRNDVVGTILLKSNYPVDPSNCVCLYRAESTVGEVEAAGDAEPPHRH